MKNSMRYKINSPAVAHEVIEGEVVIIHFDTGNYYGMRGSAVEMWGLITQGASLEEVLTALAGRFEGDALVVERELRQFADQLITENLIVESAQAGVVSVGTSESTSRRAFEPPIIEKYSDMQEMLLLDPIHDVDEAGWPREKA